LDTEGFVIISNNSAVLNVSSEHGS